MNFVTLEFAAFFVVFLVLNMTIRRTSPCYPGFLILANFLFYSCMGVAGAVLLLGVALAAHGAALFIGRRRGKVGDLAAVTIFILLCIGLLIFFKYFQFLVLVTSDLLAFMGSPLSLLPLLNYEAAYIAGLSFFLFQAMSYVIDLYRGTIKHPYTFLETLAYVSFFPTLLSGPILRAGQFVPQMYEQSIDETAMQDGFLLILGGLFKKVVLSSYLSEYVVKGVFNAPDTYASIAVWVGVYGYALQIFCDFSGYTDLAMGVGRLMGYDIPENFRSPYLSKNVQDFWRRWHITLSAWLRDYLYIPLGGNRRGNVYFNIFLTMVLGGLWHGANFTFMAWGALHGIGLVVHRAFRKHFPKTTGMFAPQWGVLAWMLTFHYVAFLWIFFRAENMDIAFAIFRRMFEFASVGEGFPVFAVPVITAGMALQIWGSSLHDACLRSLVAIPCYVRGVLIGVVGACIMSMGPDGVLPFIYFGF
ncbi:MBOAT family O-acyltransferase [uncultured Mailhella sp.]|uniref:MBOAT family O-acyltransferase n=1 Tax=uncultured Mailhella sp. TaxID=1981031 RepID=UPI002631D9CB|nr:MBOAT family O-acyltransferase [uncultured Mailhella sp.]